MHGQTLFQLPSLVSCQGYCRIPWVPCIDAERQQSVGWCSHGQMMWCWCRSRSAQMLEQTLCGSLCKAGKRRQPAPRFGSSSSRTGMPLMLPSVSVCFPFFQNNKRPRAGHISRSPEESIPSSLWPWPIRNAWREHEPASADTRSAGSFTCRMGHG